MKKVNIEELNPFTQLLVINDLGEIIIMEEDSTHAKFFQELIKEKLGYDIKEDNLKILTSIVLNNFNYLPYYGCKPGDRSYNGGSLYLKSLTSLNNKQLQTTIDLHSKISPFYDISFIKLSISDGDDQIISVGEIYEELLTRNKKEEKTRVN